MPDLLREWDKMTKKESTHYEKMMANMADRPWVWAGIEEKTWKEMEPHRRLELWKRLG